MTGRPWRSGYHVTTSKLKKNQPQYSFNTTCPPSSNPLSNKTSRTSQHVHVATMICLLDAVRKAPVCNAFECLTISHTQTPKWTKQTSFISQCKMTGNAMIASPTVVALAIHGQDTRKKQVMTYFASPMAAEDGTTKAAVRYLHNDKEDNAKGNCSP